MSGGRRRKSVRSAHQRQSRYFASCSVVCTGRLIRVLVEKCGSESKSVLGFCACKVSATTPADEGLLPAAGAVAS